MTGGSRGIGRASVLAFAREGCDVSFTYLTHEEEAKDVAEGVRARGRSALALGCDVASPPDVSRATRATLQRFRRLDVLVNNAGILVPSPLEQVTDAVWERTIQDNLKGAFNMCRAAAPALRKAQGRIINVSSIAGLMGGVAGVHYAASKAGLLGLTKALAAELAPDRVLVNAIAPDGVDTALLSPELGEKVRKLNLLEKLIRPEEVAEAVLFLARTDTLTGQTLNFNAGRYVF